MPQIDTVTIRKENSSATVHLFGATLISWKPSEKEALFVSEKSCFDNKTPIRGGVPVVFPNFGPWSCGPQHGFARRMMWSMEEGKEEDPSKVTLVLEETVDTLKLWPFKFRIEYILSIQSDQELKMDVTIRNRDEKNFSFTFLLHNYFLVPDIEKCTIKGLKSCSYYDKIKDLPAMEMNNEVKISELTDKVYYDTPPFNTLCNAVENSNIKILKINLPDTVVWNPWRENARKMADFGDEEYKEMVCVEAGYVEKPYSLESGTSVKMSQSFQIM